MCLKVYDICYLTGNVILLYHFDNLSLMVYFSICNVYFLLMNVALQTDQSDCLL